MSTPVEYLVVIEPASDGSFSAFVPDLPGCVSCGDTREEIEEMIREAVLLHIESLRLHGDTVPEPAAIASLVVA